MFYHCSCVHGTVCDYVYNVYNRCATKTKLREWLWKWENVGRVNKQNVNTVWFLLHLFLSETAHFRDSFILAYITHFARFSPQNEHLFGAPCLWITNHLFQNLHVFVCIIRMMSIYSMYSDVREIYPNRILLRAVPYRSSKWKSKPSHGICVHVLVATIWKHQQHSLLYFVNRTKWKKGKSVWNTRWIRVLDWLKIFLIELFFISISFWFSLHFVLFCFILKRSLIIYRKIMGFFQCFATFISTFQYSSPKEHFPCKKRDK